MHKHFYLHLAFNSTCDDDAGQKSNLMYLSGHRGYQCSVENGIFQALLCKDISQPCTF